MEKNVGNKNEALVSIIHRNNKDAAKKVGLFMSRCKSEYDTHGTESRRLSVRDIEATKGLCMMKSQKEWDREGPKGAPPIFQSMKTCVFNKRSFKVCHSCSEWCPGTSRF